MLKSSVRTIVFIVVLIIVYEATAKPAELSLHSNDEVNDFNENENKILNEFDYREMYAKKIMTYMNQSVDPCDDFYDYACGEWKNVINERQSKHKRSNLLDIVYKVGNVIQELLQKPAEALDIEYANEWKLVQQFYNSCRNANLDFVEKSNEYTEVIKSIGGFPAIDDTWQADNFSWFNMSAHLSKYGINSLTNEEIVPQYPFPPFFKLPELGFDFIVHSDNIARSSEFNRKRIHKYLAMYEVNEKKISEITSKIFQFWQDVLQVVDKFKEDFTECAAMESNPFEEWTNYLEIAWDGKNFNTSYTECPCNYFYNELDKICNKDKETVANYLSLKFLFQMDARLIAPKFQEDYCILATQNSFLYLIDKIYLNTQFNQDIQDSIFNIIKEIRKSLRSTLEEADWLDETTRTQALLKESTIITRLGNCEDKELRHKLIKEINNLTFTDDNYQLNNINLHKFRVYINRYNGLHNEELSNTTKPNELLVGMRVNAFYYNIDNSINVMAGLLHPPAYHKLWPNSLKFGTLGYLVGHEFTHGFDTVGSLFDSTGQEHYWWSKKSGKVFDERANCYVNHFNKYKIPEINRTINGNKTKDENIADSGGLREALNAYRRFVKESYKDHDDLSALKNEQLPGLNLSPEQLFFLGYAQLWCSAYKEEHYWEELTNEHTIDKYRVLGAVTNNEDFAKVYNCPMGSKMNPSVDKCNLW